MKKAFGTGLKTKGSYTVKLHKKTKFKEPHKHVLLIDKEITWCEVNSAPEGLCKPSFIKGLEQARNIILKAAR